MSYGLIDDELHLNRKVRGFTSDEFRLWMMAISYSRKHKTHGHLTEEDVESVAGGQLLRRPKAVLAGLLQKRGFDRIESGYRIHDWDAMPYDRLAEVGRAGGTARAQSAVRTGGRFTSAAGEVLDQRTTSDPPAVHQPRAGTPSPTPPPEREKESPNGLSKERAQAQRVVDTWAFSKGKSAGELKLTKDRLRVIAARLGEGYSVEDLEEAACGWQNDPWEGRAQQNELEILLRSGAQVEKFRDLHRKGAPVVALQTRASQGVRAGRQWADLAQQLKEAGH